MYKGFRRLPAAWKKWYKYFIFIYYLSFFVFDKYPLKEKILIKLSNMNFMVIMFLYEQMCSPWKKKSKCQDILTL